MKRHQLDLFSLIAGLAFVAIAVLYLLDAAGQLSVNGRLVIPLLLVALGVAGLAGAIYRMARGQREAPPEQLRPDSRDSREEGRGDGRYEDLSADLDSMGLFDDESERRR
ncbi:hypothetical protein [Streptacidiphilus carbonis]|uniref:hypothetical protein n=1 Tax=Streptacidiphilus carbonis TaxID=105422 RepID=UPI0005AAE663|nr:hypothetical protein [Streptacidiphilus carbonis]